MNSRDNLMRDDNPNHIMSLELDQIEKKRLSLESEIFSNITDSGIRDSNFSIKKLEIRTTKPKTLNEINCSTNSQIQENKSNDKKKPKLLFEYYIHNSIFVPPVKVFYFFIT